LNMAEFLVDSYPQEQWKRKISKEQLIEEIDHALDALPGLDQSFSQPIRDNILESISQIDGQIVVKVFGEDSLVLQEKAQGVLDGISKVRGVARAFIDRAGESPQLQIEIDRARSSSYGLNISAMQEVIETVLGGKAASELWEGEKHFSVVVRFPEARRKV